VHVARYNAYNYATKHGVLNSWKKKARICDGEIALTFAARWNETRKRKKEKKKRGAAAIEA